MCVGIKGSSVMPPTLMVAGSLPKTVRPAVGQPVVCNFVPLATTFDLTLISGGLTETVGPFKFGECKPVTTTIAGPGANVELNLVQMGASSSTMMTIPPAGTQKLARIAPASVEQGTDYYGRTSVSGAKRLLPTSGHPMLGAPAWAAT